MDVYIYAADIYCEDCGKAIRADIRKKLKDAGDSSNPRSPDSDEWPQGPYPDGGGEADCPQHCGSHENCLNAFDYGDGHKSGIFLENPLTTYGEAYVRQEHKEHPTAISAMWMEHYGLTADDESENDSDDSDDSGDSE